MSSLYDIHIGDVIILCFLVLKCLHQFSCSSYQEQGLPSTINQVLRVSGNYRCDKNLINQFQINLIRIWKCFIVYV